MKRLWIFQIWRFPRLSPITTLLMKTDSYTYWSGLINLTHHMIVSSPFAWLITIVLVLPVSSWYTYKWLLLLPHAIIVPSCDHPQLTIRVLHLQVKMGEYLYIWMERRYTACSPDKSNKRKDPSSQAHATVLFCGFLSIIHTGPPYESLWFSTHKVCKFTSKSCPCNPEPNKRYLNNGYSLSIQLSHHINERMERFSCPGIVYA